MADDHAHDPLQPHAHDPNPYPPSADPRIDLNLPRGTPRQVTIADLRALPQTSVPDCYIVSTGHGTSGPFTFSGVQLLHLLGHYVDEAWGEIEVMSADGFGNRVFRHELENPSTAGPIILATRVDDSPLSRQDGLVRLIVPSERDDALRQVKWVARINVRPPADDASHT